MKVRGIEIGEEVIAASLEQALASDGSSLCACLRKALIASGVDQEIAGDAAGRILQRRGNWSR